MFCNFLANVFFIVYFYVRILIVYRPAFLSLELVRDHNEPITEEER